MVYTEGTAPRRHRAGVKCLEGAAFEKAASAFRFKEGTTTTAWTLLLEDLVTVTEAFFDRVRAKFRIKDGDSVAGVV